MAEGCPPPNVTVNGYYRSKPRRLRPKGAYWECRNGSRSCGRHHTSEAASLRHSVQLDRVERKAGRAAKWEPHHHD